MIANIVNGGAGISVLRAAVFTKFDNGFVTKWSDTTELDLADYHLSTDGLDWIFDITVDHNIVSYTFALYGNVLTAPTEMGRGGGVVGFRFELDNQLISLSTCKSLVDTFRISCSNDRSFIYRYADNKYYPAFKNFPNSAAENFRIYVGKLLQNGDITQFPRFKPNGNGRQVFLDVNIDNDIFFRELCQCGSLRIKSKLFPTNLIDNKITPEKIETFAQIIDESPFSVIRSNNIKNISSSSVVTSDIDRIKSDIYSLKDEIDYLKSKLINSKIENKGSSGVYINIFLLVLLLIALVLSFSVFDKHYTKLINDGINQVHEEINSVNKKVKEISNMYVQLSSSTQPVTEIKSNNPNESLEKLRLIVKRNGNYKSVSDIENKLIEICDESNLVGINLSQQLKILNPNDINKDGKVTINSHSIPVRVNVPSICACKLINVLPKSGTKENTYDLP